MNPDDRVILFNNHDLDPLFEAAGIDPDSLTRDEWRQFYNAFLEGTGWFEVAQIAAETIKYMRLEA